VILEIHWVGLPELEGARASRAAPLALSTGWRLAGWRLLSFDSAQGRHEEQSNEREARDHAHDYTLSH
jgi:hypothetical protein